MLTASVLGIALMASASGKAESVRVLMLCKACVVGIYQRKSELIAAQGVDLTVVVPAAWRDERGETPLERVHTQGYRLEVLPIRLNGNFHLHHYTGIGRFVQQAQPQVVHIDEEPYNAASWQMLHHARRVGARTLFFSWQNIYRRYPPPFRWGESWVLRHVDYALVGTESAAQVWRQKGYSGPLGVVPQFGTDPALFTPSPRPDRPFTLGYIGRLVPEKGLDTLFEALRGLHGDWRLRIVGGGPLLETLNGQVAALGWAQRVTFVGQVPSTEMPAHYAALDALVLPSRTRPNWKEQFGRVLVEAMSSGVPVVGSDSGAIPDVIGDAGVVVPEGDVDALCTALQSLHDDAALGESLAERGRARVLAHFTHAQVAADTVAVYRQILGL